MSTSKPTRQEKLLLLRKNRTRLFYQEMVVVMRHPSVKGKFIYRLCAVGMKRLLVVVKRSYWKLRRPV